MLHRKVKAYERDSSTYIDGTSKGREVVVTDQWGKNTQEEKKLQQRQGNNEFVVKRKLAGWSIAGMESYRYLEMKICRMKVIGKGRVKRPRLWGCYGMARESYVGSGGKNIVLQSLKERDREKKRV